MSIYASFDGHLKTKIIPYEPRLVQLEHEKIRLGQIAYVVAKDKGLLAAVDVRVTRIERYLKEPWKTRIVFGDPIPLDSDYIAEIERMAAWRDKRRRMLDRGRGPATVTVAHETTSNAPYYARYIIRAGQMVNEVMPEILALLPPEGGQIVFMEGVYEYDGDIIIDRDNVSIKGQGEGTKFVLKAGTTSSTGGITASGKSGLEISDLAMNGQWEQQNEEYSHDGVYLINCRNSKISGLKVYNFLNRGVRLQGCEEVGVLSSTLIDNNNNLYAEDCENLTVTGNNARKSRADCIFFTKTNNSIISNNFCNQTVYRQYMWINGIRLLGCNSVTVSDNVCSENSGNGILVEALNPFTPDEKMCLDLIISGNQCNSNYYHYGMKIFKAKRATITNNTCCFNEGNGIDLDSSEDCSIQNNTLTDNLSYGISIGGRRNFVTNNDCQNNGAGGVMDYGTSTVTAPGNRW